MRVYGNSYKMIRSLRNTSMACIGTSAKYSTAQEGLRYPKWRIVRKVVVILKQFSRLCASTNSLQSSHKKLSFL